MDGPSTGFGLFPFTSLEPSLLNYTPSPYRSPSPTRTRNFIFSPFNIHKLDGQPRYEAIEAAATEKDLEESLGLIETPAFSPYCPPYDPAVDTVDVFTRLSTPKDGAPDEMVEDSQALASNDDSEGTTIDVETVHERADSVVIDETDEASASESGSLFPQTSPPPLFMEVAQTSTINTTNSFRSHFNEARELPVNVKGTKSYDRPKNKSDVFFLLNEGVRVSQFAEHTRVGDEWHCHGRYALKKNGRFTQTASCNGMKLSSRDNFDRHVKREHFNMGYDIPRSVLDLEQWAKECKFKLRKARGNARYRINWLTAGSYPALPPA